MAEQAPSLAADLAQAAQAAETLSNLALRQFRLSMAVRHAERQGIDTNPLAIAAAHGLDHWSVVRAIINGDDLDQGASLSAVAQRLGVPVSWMLYGRNDPEWYRDAVMGVESPRDPLWTQERSRLTTVRSETGA